MGWPVEVLPEMIWNCRSKWNLNQRDCRGGQWPEGVLLRLLRHHRGPQFAVERQRVSQRGKTRDLVLQVVIRPLQRGLELHQAQPQKRRPWDRLASVRRLGWEDSQPPPSEP